MPPDRRRQLTRADLPQELTPETIRQLPISVLRRLTRPDNGVLSPEEQQSFDAAVHTVMSESARRVSGQIKRSDWADVVRDANRSAGRRGGPGRSSGADDHVRRLARRIGQQVDVAEGLAPGVDWSFAQPDALDPPPVGAPRPDAESEPDPEPQPEPDGTDHDDQTVSELEQQLTDQVELVQVMTEIADVGRRTYELEQQRDLQNTRTVFFGFVVSVAVLVAGWAPIVAAEDWTERWWVLGLTVATCVVAGVVYALVRRWQNRPDPDHQEAESS